VAAEDVDALLDLKKGTGDYVREASTGLLVTADTRSNVTDLLRERCANDPHHALYAQRTANGWINVSTHRFFTEVTALAKGLIAGGLAPGEPVAVLSRSSYEWTLVDFAIWFAGGVTVPVDDSSSASQLEWILVDSGARRVFVEDQDKERLVQDVLANSQLLGEDPIPVVRMETAGPAPSLGSLKAAGVGISDAELERQRSRAGLSDVASIVYTAGTTGKPKGCEITHGNFVLVARNAIPFLPELLLRPGARALMSLPLAQVPARGVQVTCLAAGVTVGHSPGGEALLADLKTFKPTFLLAVPRIFEKVYDRSGNGAGRGPGFLGSVRQALFGKPVYSGARSVFGGSLDYAVTAGAPLGRHEAHFFAGAGLPVLEGYGLGETTAPCTVNTPSMARVGTVGIPLPGTTIRVADDGEVLVKGIGVFKGYHANEAATAEAFSDGFFRTGDLGELDDQGFLTITGRKKDLLVTASGKSVAPAPLEEAVREHPLVAHVVVVGDGRPFVTALVDLDPDGLERWCVERGVPILTPAEAASDAGVREAVQSAVDRANRLVPMTESIRSFTLLDAAFSVESGHLTPSLKVRRHAVMKAFAAEIERLYAASPAA
jgi:long-chain acyl-CoA synthetase